MKKFKRRLFNRVSKGLDRFLSLMTLPSTQKVMMVIALVLCSTISVFAQDGTAGFSTATTTIKGYQSQVSALMKAIGAVIAIVGAFNIFFKMQNGDQDVKKTIMLTIGGCIAFVALGEALPMFFGE